MFVRKGAGDSAGEGLGEEERGLYKRPVSQLHNIVIPSRM